ncbi:MAG: glycosyltransferase family 4 protein [Phycisphaerae bacterium]|nr:glycosyltransferase family 4 protein [Phycisphaerae bacterium]
MKKIAHIIDQHTPLDMLEQLFALRNDGEEIFSIGPAPDLSPITGGEVKISKLTNHQFPGREKASLPTGAGLHIWGADTFRNAVKCKNFDSGSAVLSLACLPQAAASLELIGSWQVIVTVPTNSAKSKLSQCGIAESKIEILPPAAKPFDVAAAKIARQKIRESLGITDRDKLVVVPAEMQRYAGHKLASWAHAIAEQLVDNCKIVFPGGGPYYQSVKFFADTTGYPDDVFFTGGRFTTQDILHAADIATFFYERNCGVTMLAKTMLAGLPILAAKTGDIASICRCNETALLIKPKDPRQASAVLMQVIEDDKLAQTLGQNAAAFAAANFAPGQIRKKLDEIYTKLITRENN